MSPRAPPITSAVCRTRPALVQVRGLVQAQGSAQVRGLAQVREPAQARELVQVQVQVQTCVDTFYANTILLLGPCRLQKMRSLGPGMRYRCRSRLRMPIGRRRMKAGKREVPGGTTGCGP